jgi:hypothetical protein
MEISTQIRFKSAPADVRRAILDYMASHYPRAADYITWDAAGRSARASKMGASGELRLSGEGPTLVDIKARIGFPASMAVSASRIRQSLDRAVRDLKKRTP